MKNIMLVTNIPNLYRVPLFNVMDRMLRESDARLIVVFGAMGYERRKFELNPDDMEFDYRVLDTKRISYKDKENVSFTYDGLCSVIKDIRPDVIIVNAFSIATVKVWLRSFFVRTRYIIWSGAIDHAAVKISSARKLLRKLLVRRASGFVSYGSLARKYLVSLGANDNDVYIGINTVDAAYFSDETERLRSDLNNGNDIQLLCVSYLTKRKRIDLLLRSIHSLKKYRSDFSLDILGDGPELADLEGLVEELEIEKFVNFRGFVQKEDLPGYFCRTTVFLFPTDFDVWGLTLIEAMAAGLVCIASQNAGATSDLIRQGVTGFWDDFEDPDSIARRIAWVIDHKKNAEKIGVAAADFIKKNVSLEKSAIGFIDSINAASR